MFGLRLSLPVVTTIQPDCSSLLLLLVFFNTIIPSSYPTSLITHDDEGSKPQTIKYLFESKLPNQCTSAMFTNLSSLSNNVIRWIRKRANVMS